MTLNHDGEVIEIELHETKWHAVVCVATFGCNRTVAQVGTDRSEVTRMLIQHICAAMAGAGRPTLSVQQATVVVESLQAA
ncbi:MAG: hypothetical protein ACLP1X_31080 [Polyangiaceae bacterium]|jgi:hypothetical protein